MHKKHFIIIFYFSKKKTPSISYKILQLRMLYTNSKKGLNSFILCGGPLTQRKGEDEHFWMKVDHCLSAPLVPPLMPSYWLLSIATTSLRISYNTFGRCTIWLEKTHVQLLLFVQWKCLLYTTYIQYIGMLSFPTNE